MSDDVDDDLRWEEWMEMTDEQHEAILDRVNKEGIALNGERAAVAWWKGVAAGGLTVLAVVAVMAGWYAEYRS